MSPLGALVADILGQLVQGIYHIEEEVHDTDWSNPTFIEIISKGGYLERLSTWDGNMLTLLVIAAHEACLRVDISPTIWFERYDDEGEVVKSADKVSTEPVQGIRTLSLVSMDDFTENFTGDYSCPGRAALRFLFSQRQRDAKSISQRHPSMTAAIESANRLLHPIREKLDAAGRS